MRKQIALYGGGGVGKTSFIRTMARYFWERDKSKTLVLSFDPGGAAPLEAAVSSGAVTLVQVGPTPYALRALDLVSQGYVPVDPAKPVKFKKVDFQKEGYRALAVEGLSAWGKRIMDWARDKQANGEQVGQMDGAKIGMFKDGAEGDVKSYGVNTMSHYGVAQSYLGTFVQNMCGLWSEGVECILWTALELKGTDEDRTTPMYGPLLAGKAVTGPCIPWFTDVWHLDSVADPATVKGTGERMILGERKVYLTRHYAAGDPIPYLGKTSVDPDGKMPTTMLPDFAIFMKELEAANVRAAATWTKGTEKGVEKGAA